MGLLRAIIIVVLCSFVVNKLWYNKVVPLPKSQKRKYEKHVILATIFLTELVS